MVIFYNMYLNLFSFYWRNIAIKVYSLLLVFMPIMMFIHLVARRSKSYNVFNYLKIPQINIKIIYNKVIFVSDNCCPLMKLAQNDIYIRWHYSINF